jgi:hypothetical protein
MISMPESRIANRGMTAACPVILRSEATKDLRFLLARKTEILHFAQDDREGMVQVVNRQSPIVNRS